MKPRTFTAVILATTLLCGWSIAADEERERERDKPRGDREEHVERERGGDREHAERREREHAERREAEMHREREQGERREMAERREREQGERREREVPEGRILEFVEVNMPHMLPGLRELREREPEAYRHQLREIGERIRQYDEMKQHAPDVAEALLRSHQVEHECHKLAESIRQSDNPEKRKPQIAKLGEMLNHVFELRLKEPELRIMHLEREINEIKGMIERRKENRERIVAKHLKEMVGPAEEGELEWW